MYSGKIERRRFIKAFSNKINTYSSILTSEIGFALAAEEAAAGVGLATTFSPSLFS